MGFGSVKEVLDAIDNGKTWTGMFRRINPSMYNTLHCDLSYGGGGPPANYYASAPLNWQTLSKHDGIDHGPDTPSGEKFLHRMWALSAPASGAQNLTLCDYLAYAPFLDGDETAEQILPDFTLPRYSDGGGVQVMLVTQGVGVSFAYYSLRYINQDGVEKVTPLWMNRGGFSSGGAGVITGSVDATGNAYSVFARLCVGDSGVRSVKSIQLDTSTGAIFAVVLVKPLCTIQTKDASGTPHEIDFLRQGMKMPKIYNGAYLNFIGRSLLNAAPATFAELNFVWP